MKNDVRIRKKNNQYIPEKKINIVGIINQWVSIGKEFDDELSARLFLLHQISNVNNIEQIYDIVS